MRRLIRWLVGRKPSSERPLPRVIPPVWATDDDLALLRRSGLL